MKTRIIYLISLASLAPAPAVGQGLVHIFDGLEDACTTLGDVDGDGFPELAVAHAGSASEIGRVSVRSGRTGEELYAISGTTPGDDFGIALARVDDLDGDGHDDLAIGAPLASPPAVSLRSGKTGVEIGSIIPTVGGAFGAVLGAGGDADGDGVADLLVSSPRQNHHGARGFVEVRSLGTGTTVVTHTTGFITSLSFVGDVDGDGLDDYALGEPGIWFAPSPGRVRVFSGASGALLYSLAGTSDQHGFGTSVAGVVDVDGDGAGELLVGAPGEQVASYTTGAAYLYSGATGTLLRHWPAPMSGTVMFGKGVASAGDYDGDGTADLIAMHSHTWVGGVVKNIGRAYVYSGATGAELGRFDLWGRFGPVANAGDVNLDGIDDLLVADRGTADNLSSLLLLGGAPLPSYYCEAKRNAGGCLPSNHWSGSQSLSIGGELTVHTVDAPGASLGLFLWGLAEAGTPFEGGTLCVATPLTRTRPVSTGGYAGGCDGGLSFTFTRDYLAANALTAGTDVFVQAWIRDPGYRPPLGVALSSGVKFTLWP